MTPQISRFVDTNRPWLLLTFIAQATAQIEKKSVVVNQRKLAFPWGGIFLFLFYKFSFRNSS
jgi:hypothetical protein